LDTHNYFFLLQLWVGDAWCTDARFLLLLTFGNSNMQEIHAFLATVERSSH
jgi:hypothetical protein